MEKERVKMGQCLSSFIPFVIVSMQIIMLSFGIWNETHAIHFIVQVLIEFVLALCKAIGNVNVHINE